MKAKERIKELTKIGARGSITIPASLRKAAGLEPGDIVLIEVTEDNGEIVIRPQVAVDRSQAWFWTERWQKMEHEVDRDIAAGKEIESTPEDFLREIKKW